MDITDVILYYLAIINPVTFIIYGIDKLKARHHAWRIPEMTLLGLAAIGGATGALAGMILFRHKTLHKKFRYGLPVLFILNIIVFGHMLVYFSHL